MCLCRDVFDFLGLAKEGRENNQWETDQTTCEFDKFFYFLLEEAPLEESCVLPKVKSRSQNVLF